MSISDPEVLIGAHFMRGRGLPKLACRAARPGCVREKTQRMEQSAPRVCAYAFWKGIVGPRDWKLSPVGNVSTSISSVPIGRADVPRCDPIECTHQALGRNTLMVGWQAQVRHLNVSNILRRLDLRIRVSCLVNMHCQVHRARRAL